MELKNSWMPVGLRMLACGQQGFFFEYAPPRCRDLLNAHKLAEFMDARGIVDAGLRQGFFLNTLRRAFGTY